MVLLRGGGRTCPHHPGRRFLGGGLFHKRLYSMHEINTALCANVADKSTH